MIMNQMLNVSASLLFVFFYLPGMVSGKEPPPNPDVLQWPHPAHPKTHVFDSINWMV